MQQPAVSVLTPAYNDAAFLPDCIGSVAEAATHAGITVEHIVVDDGSADDTRAVLAGLPSVLTHRLPVNQGASAALNAAAALASAPWLLTLAADDMVTQTAFADWADAVTLHPNANVVYSDLELFGRETGFYRPPPFRKSLLRERNILPGCAFFRRTLFDAVGGFACELRTAQDWDFWVRADLRAGLKPVKVARPMVRYRRHHTPRLHNATMANIESIRAHIRRLYERAA